MDAFHQENTHDHGADGIDHERQHTMTSFDHQGACVVVFSGPTKDQERLYRLPDQRWRRSIDGQSVDLLRGEDILGGLLALYHKLTYRESISDPAGHIWIRLIIKAGRGESSEEGLRFCFAYPMES